jgi:hypothetical protein
MGLLEKDFGQRIETNFLLIVNGSQDCFERTEPTRGYLITRNGDILDRGSFRVYFCDYRRSIQVRVFAGHLHSPLNFPELAVVVRASDSLSIWVGSGTL